MLYHFVKLMMRAALGLFYNRILPRNLDKVPPTGPALLIANHPSSLMDAAVVGILLKRPVHFFARGDIFINPFITKILNALHMHPVHHHDAGRQTIRANDASFEKAIQLLCTGELVLFFPEGTSHTEYRLWNFRKGAFRIALQTLQRNQNRPLPIIPIGINYSHPTHLFSTVWVQAGTPVMANDYYLTYATQPSVALNQLTKKAFESMQSLVTDCGSGSPELLYQALDMARNERAYSRNSATDPISQDIACSKSFRNFSEQTLLELQAYKEKCRKFDTTDKIIASGLVQKNSLLPLIVGLPAAVIGWFLNSLPLLFARTLTDQKVNRIDFYSWIMVTAAAFLSIAWYIIMATFAFIFLPAWKAVALLFIAISTGQYCWNYFAYYKAWKTQEDAFKLPAEELKHLQGERKKVMELINAHSLSHQQLLDPAV